MESVVGNTELINRPNIPDPIHKEREIWCRYNMKDIAMKHPNCKKKRGFITR